MLRTPDYFDAKARIQIDPEGSTRPGGNSSGGADPSYVNTELQMITSPRVLLRVVETLNLEHDPVFLRHRAKGGRILRALLHLTYLGKRWEDEGASSLNAAIPQSLAPSAALEFEQAKRLASFVKEIRQRIRVEPIKETRSVFRETRLVDIVVRHQSAAMATKLANAISQALVLANKEQTSEAGRLLSYNLLQRAEDLQRSIRKSEAQSSEYAKSHEIVSLDPGQNTTVDRLMALNRQLLEAENELRLAEANYQTALQPDAAAALAEDNVKGAVTETENKLTDLRAKKARLLITATDKWPEVKEVTREIEILDEHLKDIRTQGRNAIVQSLNARYREALARDEAQRSAFDQQRAATQSQNRAAVTYRLIQQETDTNKKILNGLLESLGAAEVVKAGATNNVHIIDYAVTPDLGEPEGPWRLQYILLAMVLSTCVAVASALVMGHVDDKIYSDDEVRSVLHVRALGDVQLSRRRLPAIRGFGSLEPRKSRDLLVAGDFTSLLAEDYRRLRASVFMSPSVRPGKCLLFTSSVSGEGKTTTAVNVAVSLAQTGARVVLVDADLRCPKLHSIFELDNKNGLSTFLSGTQPASEIPSMLCGDTRNRVSILPAGLPPNNPSELAGSQRMHVALDALKSTFDYVVIDAPTIESCVDTILMGSKVDGVVMVVLSAHTSRRVVQRACQTLVDSGGKLMGVVLNHIGSRSDRYSVSSGSNRA